MSAPTKRSRRAAVEDDVGGRVLGSEFQASKVPSANAACSLGAGRQIGRVRLEQVTVSPPPS